MPSRSFVSSFPSSSLANTSASLTTSTSQTSQPYRPFSTCSGAVPSASPVTWMDAAASHSASCITLPSLQSAFHRLASLILIKCKSKHSIFSWLRIASGIKANMLNISHEALLDLTLAFLQLHLMPLFLSVHTGSFSLPQILQALDCLEALAIGISSA